MGGHAGFALNAKFDKETFSVDVDIYVENPNDLVFEYYDSFYDRVFVLNYLNTFIVGRVILNIGESVDNVRVPDTVFDEDFREWKDGNIVNQYWYFVPNPVDS